ncbi:carbohydrate ABC transporter ATP-binding protein, CUT1 family [Rhizobiales bacterium GAS191]|nr:carbohydrate ABC transporter ATP-binding protein, CUT1 family [Rhizobiales bacterium GAS191]
MGAGSDVDVRGVEIGYGTLKVLEKLDLHIAASEFVVLLGPSGCGKSTLLNAIAGLIDIQAGQIWIGGRNATWDEPKDRGIAMVFQSYALYPRMTTRGNMSFGLKVAGLPQSEIGRRVQDVAQMLQITELLDRRPSELSGGQRQRVAIGRALVREAGVYLFDEPLSNLDAQLRAELRVEIKRLHQRLKATMIYVTHDQIEALTLADRIAVMKDRIIQQLGTPQEIYQRPANRFVASFVGSPAMNFLPGEIRLGADGVAFEAEGLSLPMTGYRFTAAPKDGAKAELGVRPEHMGISPNDFAVNDLAVNGLAVNDLQAVIEMIEPMGSDQLAWTRLGGASASLRLPSESAVRAGDRISISISPTKASLFDFASGQRL